MKKILIAIMTIIGLAFSALSTVSYADAKTESATSTESADIKNTEESYITEGEKDVKSSDLKKAGETVVSAASLAGEPDSGGMGKGVSLSPLLSESFQTDLATGAATVNIPIVVPPGRKNMQPQIALSYSSNNQNGVCGVGWSLTSSCIQRSTKKGPPKYDDLDIFVFASSGSTGELIVIDEANNEYRQKIETSFMKYVYDGVNSKWVAWDKNGTKYSFGSTEDSRIVDPGDASKIFAWYLDTVEDMHGNTVEFTYEKDNSQVYLANITYTNNNSATSILHADKAVVFIYKNTENLELITSEGNITIEKVKDYIYNYRSGFKVEINKRLTEVHILTNIEVDASGNITGSLAWRYELQYLKSDDTHRLLLRKITLYDAEGKNLPSKVFTYQKI